MEGDDNHKRSMPQSTDQEEQKYQRTLDEDENHPQLEISGDTDEIERVVEDLPTPQGRFQDNPLTEPPQAINPSIAEHTLENTNTEIKAPSPVVCSAQGLFVYSSPKWTGTLALISRKDGKPTPIATMAAFPQLQSQEEEFSDVFHFEKWPLQLLISGVCPAREVVVRYKDVARIVIFKILHTPSPDPTSPQPHFGIPAPPRAAPICTEKQTPPPPQPETQQIETAPQTYISLMLAQLHEKGLASVIETPNNTLLIVPHKDRPLGILLPKLELKTKNPNPLTAPPPLPGAVNCIICLQSAATYAFVPCGHLCLCYECLHPFRGSAKGSLCPVCRTQIVSSLRIFSP